jgi:PAS domain S-box-containing protein
MRMDGDPGTFEKWDEFLEHASLGVHLVDAGGTIQWANETELTFLGYTREEYFGKSIAEFHVDPDVIRCILNLLTDNKSLHTYPARLRAKDGTTKHVLINSNVFRRNGEFVHTRCFTTAISEGVYRELRKEQGTGSNAA